MVIEIWEDEPRAGTYLIAQGFGREHEMIKKMVKKYESDFEDFGTLKVRKLRSTGGRAANEILLNEDQTMFLGTLLRNSGKVVKFKKDIISAFKKCRKSLTAIEKHKTTESYQITRDIGKLVRLQTTDAMQTFVKYAESQGSQNANMYYANITRMVNGMMFIVEGKFKNLREVMSVKQLMTVSSAEQIVERGLLDGMSRKKYYKDIYKDIKAKIMLFADLHGKTEVIEQAMLAE